MKLSEYLIDNQGKSIDSMGLLRNDRIIDENNIVNVLNLVGQELNTGKGSDYKDVYSIENNHLYYYSKDGEKIDLGDLGNLDGYTPTDPSIFEIADDGTIGLKNHDEYYKRSFLKDI